MLREVQFRPTSGFTALFGFLFLAAASLFSLVAAGQAGHPAVVAVAIVVLVVSLIALSGLFTVNPGDAKAMVLFGDISLRVRNFETTKLKVNDGRANPVEIAAIVVWRVVETAEALFEVDDYQKYVAVQSESAVRAVAQSYPYDSHADTEHSLSTHTAEVSLALQKALQDRLSRAGVEILEARISHLAYAAEIAQAMLRRQQATAVIAARYKIVEGAVGMVENALELLSHKGIVRLDEERKAQMVSNLLVVLCSERDASPIVNAGSIHQ
jgi:regulator of protease activity HflC (stomatin/prohibitin superfamily)